MEFKARRRAPGEVPSSIQLDHGDLLVMDGLAQSEYEHCTAFGLQGHRVHFTYRWVTQHIASCPLAGAVGGALPPCAQGLADPVSGIWGTRLDYVLVDDSPSVNQGVCPSGACPD